MVGADLTVNKVGNKRKQWHQLNIYSLVYPKRLPCLLFTVMHANGVVLVCNSKTLKGFAMSKHH